MTKRKLKNISNTKSELEPEQNSETSLQQKDQVINDIKTEKSDNTKKEKDNEENYDSDDKSSICSASNRDSVKLRKLKKRLNAYKKTISNFQSSFFVRPIQKKARRATEHISQSLKNKLDANPNNIYANRLYVTHQIAVLDDQIPEDLHALLCMARKFDVGFKNFVVEDFFKTYAQIDPKVIQHWMPQYPCLQQQTVIHRVYNALQPFQKV